VSDTTLTITIGDDGYTYDPGPSSSPNTLGQTFVTMNQNSVLRVDTAPLATAQMSSLSGTTLNLSSNPSAGGQSVAVTGKRVFVNGVDSGETVSSGSGTTLTLSGSINASAGAAISFYDVGATLNMTLITPDGTEITVQGETNQPGSGAELTTTMAEVEVYASIDGRFYRTDPQSDSNRNTTAMNPQTNNSGTIQYKPVSKLQFIGGRNIDSLVTDPVSGNPLFKTTSTLTTRVTNQAGGTSDLVFELDLSDTSLQAGAFQITHSNQNGEPLARLTNVTVDNQGRIVGVYGTGKQQFVGQVALVHFDNAEGLIPVGKNAFAASVDSGTEHSADGVLVGRAGTGIFGDIKGQALESSNVDLANELVRLMVLQRSYSANSQSMKAFDQTLRDTLQMVS
jgi:flagellar hook-basal body protein